jgi:hypothetical protein
VYALYKASSGIVEGEGVPLSRPNSKLSIINKLDWNAMGEPEKLRRFSGDEVVILLDDVYVPPPFSERELVKISPSLSRKMDVRGKLL